MSVNNHTAHIVILPEDDANRQIVNGFRNNINVTYRAIKMMEPAGGWRKVIGRFKDTYIHQLKNYPKKFIILLLDFDNDKERLDYVKSNIPSELSDRVFVLGVRSEPEQLRTKTGKKIEGIGKELAAGCPIIRNELWSDELLQHNEAELDRMIPLVKSFLFTTTE